MQGMPETAKNCEKNTLHLMIFFLPVFKHIESHDVESHDKPIEIRQVEDVVHSGRRVGGMGKQG
jgi:hypothetical protein